MKIASRVGKTLLILWILLLLAAAYLQVDHQLDRIFENFFSSEEPEFTFSRSAVICFGLGFAFWLVGVVILVIDRRRSGPRRS